MMIPLLVAGVAAALTSRADVSVLSMVWMVALIVVGELMTGVALGTYSLAVAVTCVAVGLVRRVIAVTVAGRVITALLAWAMVMVLSVVITSVVYGRGFFWWRLTHII